MFRRTSSRSGRGRRDAVHFVVLVGCGGMFSCCFFRFFFFERTRPAASIRPLCLIYLSTSSSPPVTQVILKMPPSSAFNDSVPCRCRTRLDKGVLKCRHSVLSMIRVPRLFFCDIFDLLIMGQGRGSEATETVFSFRQIKPPDTGVRTGCHYSSEASF